MATNQVKVTESALNGVSEEARLGQRTTLDVLNAQQELVSARVNLISAQRDRIVYSYSLLAALGRLSPQVLGLKVSPYDVADALSAGARRLVRHAYARRSITPVPPRGLRNIQIESIVATKNATHLNFSNFFQLSATVCRSSFNRPSAYGTSGSAILVIGYFLHPLGSLPIRQRNFFGSRRKTMRASTIVMIAFAVVFGLLAVFIAQAWLNNQADLRAQKARHRQAGRWRRRPSSSPEQPLRFGTQLESVDAGGSAVAEPGAAGRRLRQDRRSLRRRPPRGAGGDRAERAGAGAEGDRRRPTRNALGAGRPRHEGGHHPRQRRRRRRRLRAARRPRRCRADAADRQDRPRPPKSCCKTPACWRSTRPPTSAPSRPRSPSR